MVGNAGEVLPEILKRNIMPDVVTDQTSAHDMLNGYVPMGMSFEKAVELREKDPAKYQELARKTVVTHCSNMWEFMQTGSVVFDYGNNLRGEAYNNCFKSAFEIPGFVPEYIRPLFCEGKGPFRWVALSGDPEDIYKTDDAILKAFPENELLTQMDKSRKRESTFSGIAIEDMLARIR